MTEQPQPVEDDLEDYEEPESDPNDHYEDAARIQDDIGWASLGDTPTMGMNLLHLSQLVTSMAATINRLTAEVTALKAAR